MRKHWILTWCLSWLLILGFGDGVLAQGERALRAPKAPLEQLLNDDGTLNLESGFRGSVDPAGWQMTSGPNGEPRFVQMTASDDDNWDAQFNSPGPSGTVQAIAISGSDVYVGGGFSTAGGVVAHNIAKWNGSSWSALGSGVSVGSPDVRAIAISGNDVYVGGGFSYAGGVVAQGIAKWDGSSWSALGNGINGGVNAIAISGSDVYVGGQFTTAGGVSANNIAKWNGSSWSTLGSGIGNGYSAVVYAIATSGSDVYVGGIFSAADGVSANNIAKWNGSSWSALGSGVNSFHIPPVHAIAVSGSDVYVGGHLTSAGGMSASLIAKWNGNSWSTLGSGLGGGDFFRTVHAIAISGSNVYVGGRFTTAGGVVVNGIAKWNGSSWSGVGNGVNAYVHAFAISGNDIYVGGTFTTAGGVSASQIAKWDGSSWSAVGGSGNGMGSRVEAIAVSGNDVYVGGSFATAGVVVANNIAKWNGSSWSALGSGVNGIVNTIAISGSDVYVGGQFTTAGGVSANRIAKWNGSTWSALGNGTNGAVDAIAISGSEVYVGGGFSMAGGLVVNYVAKWDGSTWLPLGSGVSGGTVRALAVSGSDVYVGGWFTLASGISANRIAKWNGSTWSPLGSGVGSGSGFVEVSAIAIRGSDVYVGGRFTTAGGVSASNIAKWNGSTWSALGSGVSSFVYTIAISGSDIYVGGFFPTAGGVSASKIAKWNGSTWSALGSGVNYGYNPQIYAVATNGSHVYVGGDFFTAGGKPSSYFGRYALNAPPTVDGGGPYSVGEGASVIVIASGNDPEGGPLSYAWDLDNNGSFETPGQSVTFSAAGLDGPNNHTIKVQVADNGSLTATDQATVNVLNVAPTANFTISSVTLIAGQCATLAFSNQVDLSAADVTAGFLYSYDCTNDGAFEVSDVAATSHVCVYPVNGTFTAKGRIKDKDGDFTDYTIQIVVQTPQQAIQNLIDQVNALVAAGILEPNQGHPLIVKLEGVKTKLDDGKTTPAMNELQAFINQVNAYINSNKLTPAQAQPLIDAANAIIAVVSNPCQSATAAFKNGASNGITAVDQSDGALPTGFRLEQNSPNPFNPVTTIQFAVPRESHITLKVYNFVGQEVATLADRQYAPGTYKINWDASRLASGFYLYRLEAEGFAQTKKLVLMK